MITSSATGRACALVLLLSNFALSLARAEEAANTTRSAEELVQAALRSELTGPSEVRNELLNEALRRDPDYAPARWHSGYVKFDGQWIKVDEVPRKARANESLTAYRKMRDGLIDTADNHRALARWCHKNRLLDEERIHWAKVLEFERNDEEAIAALGLQVFNGRLLTKAQCDQEKMRAADEQRAMREWQPKVVKWRKAIEHGGPKQLDDALRALGELKDPAAIPALEAVLSVSERTKKAVELNALLVDTVGRFPQQAATHVLLRKAVLAESPDVAAAACQMLRKRPMHTYVPLLIAAMPGKLSTRYNLFVMPGGAVLHEHEITLSAQKGEYRLTLESSVHPADAFAAMMVTPAASYREMASAASIEAGARYLAARMDSLRKRVRWVLQQTTGFTEVDNPELWQAAYDQYYGRQGTDEVKPEFIDRVVQFEAYATVPAVETQRPTPSATPRAPSSTVPPPSTPTFTGNRSPSPFLYGSISQSFPIECFAAGTLVQTDLGLRPIEQIRIGDRVLAQNPASGELIYLPVQTTTVRPPEPLVKIDVGSESIISNAAHPFWIVGHGWRTANHLKVGDRLHAVGGSVLVEHLGEARPAEVYNLVVADFHNFFVGNARVLVHDTSPLEMSAEILPGLALSATTGAGSE